MGSRDSWEESKDNKIPYIDIIKLGIPFHILKIDYHGLLISGANVTGHITRMLGGPVHFTYVSSLEEMKKFIGKDKYLITTECDSPFAIRMSDTEYDETDEFIRDIGYRHIYPSGHDPLKYAIFYMTQKPYFYKKIDTFHFMFKEFLIRYKELHPKVKLPWYKRRYTTLKELFTECLTFFISMIR